MNIIIINGSSRKNGATAGILHAMEQRLLQKDNVFVEFVDICNLNMAPCVGCCSCYRTGHCYINDDAEQLSDRMEKADGLIIGSPTYASNVSGQLKQLIDRGHFVIEQLLHDKYAVSVVTGENYGSRDASKVLTRLLNYSGAGISGRIIYNLPFNENPLSNGNMKKRVNYLADKLYHDIGKQKKYVLQAVIHKIIFHVGIRPFVLRKGEDYRGVLARWER